ncbi:hypothetical protein LZ30DRAFT_137675 [Colletotrichum cereale]|nr:hypothetical protein LZ30DRAFT_137675 [Colletotrichum cereale]
MDAGPARCPSPNSPAVVSSRVANMAHSQRRYWYDPGAAKPNGRSSQQTIASPSFLQPPERLHRESAAQALQPEALALQEAVHTGQYLLPTYTSTSLTGGFNSAIWTSLPMPRIHHCCSLVPLNNRHFRAEQVRRASKIAAGAHYFQHLT